MDIEERAGRYATEIVSAKNAGVAWSNQEFHNDLVAAYLAGSAQTQADYCRAMTG